MSQTMNSAPLRGAVVIRPSDRSLKLASRSLVPLVTLISDYDPESLESENALTAVILIFRDEPEAGVQYLKDAAEKASYPLQRQRLLSAAERAKGPPL
jgi:hypothetical protein